MLFSIIVPSYNRSKFIGSLINSFLNQQYPNFEMIIVDDGSTDNTREVVEAFKDSRIKYHYKPNGERGAARNYGLDLAKGDYINYFDSDDQAYPNHLSVAYDLILKYNNPPAFHLGYDYKNTTGEVLKKFNKKHVDLIENGIKTKRISVNATFIRKDVAHEVRFFEDRAMAASEDALFLCQLIARHPMEHDSTITNSIIEHEGRSMSTSSEEKLLKRRAYLIEALKGDQVFMQKFGKYIPAIYGEMTYLLALEVLLAGEKKKGLKYFTEYIKVTPSKLLSRRTLVLFKYLMKP